MIGSTNFTQRKKFFRQLKFVKDDTQISTNLNAIIKACESMGRNFTGALIIIQKSTNLDFVKNTGDAMNIEINQPIIESIFHKSGPLHDGAMVVEDNKITATRVILPVSNDRSIPLRFGLRHRAAVGITEKTDALALVVSEETGQISYLKDGEFIIFDDPEELVSRLKDDLT